MPTRPAVALVLLFVSQHALAQAGPSAPPVRPETPNEALSRQIQSETPPDALTPTSVSANPILRVPVSSLHPGGVAFDPQIEESPGQRSSSGAAGYGGLQHVQLQRLSRRQRGWRHGTGA